MQTRVLLVLAFAGFTSVALGQNTTLINPLTRFSHLNLTLPPEADWVLHSSFETPPDCGETSYTGTGRLRGRRALVTGGDSGIGRAIVIAYLREGANVAINYHSEEESDAQALADFLAQDGHTITRIPGDLRNETFCADLVHQAHDALGGLDILVNHAGYPGHITGPNHRDFAELPTEQLERIFRTNVYAPIFITRAAIPLLPPGSALIFTASDVARLPLEDGIDYSASKAAIVSITRSLGVHLVSLGIRANAVAPGLVYTPFLATAGYNTTEALETNARFPTPRLEQPVELSPIYVDLATSDKSYVTGSVWGATGGLHGF
ncbi:oxidoreductase [Massariosphaeria phaeospora]|uniref:Oxidoreductase n=1 Tax=Massariosphaeria phaeospora TaxID=100035 RepID=A0A7C8MG27_9PLEO|nr:oxidoreductase [Massariosphaeria phaeospora]